MLKILLQRNIEKLLSLKWLEKLVEFYERVKVIKEVSYEIM